MTMTLYGIKQCDTCRKALKQLVSDGHDVQFVDLRADALNHDGLLDQALVERFMANVDTSVLVNKRSTTWRQLSDKDRALEDEQAVIRLLRQHPTLLKRPLLDTGNALIVGFDAQRYAALN